MGKVQWEVQGNERLDGDTVGGGTKDARAKEEGISFRGTTCVKEKCCTVKKSGHTPLIRSQQSMPGGVSAMTVTTHGNFNMEYPCASADLQGCQRCI